MFIHTILMHPSKHYILFLDSSRNQCIYWDTSVVTAFTFHQKYEPNIEENNKDFPPVYPTIELNYWCISTFTTHPLWNWCAGSHYKLYTWMLNHSQTIWDKNEVLWEHLGEHIQNLGNILGTWRECIGNIPPSPPPLDHSHWLHENSISKTVCHHFQPELITPL